MPDSTPLNIPLIRHKLVSKSNNIKIIGLGDMHLGSSTTDYKLIKRIVDYCIKNRVHVIGQGDYCECANKTSPGSSIWTQAMGPDDQVDYAVKLFKRLHRSGLLLGCHPGNHEQRTHKSVGIDATKIITDRVGLGTQLITLSTKKYGIKCKHIGD